MDANTRQLFNKFIRQSVDQSTLPGNAVDYSHLSSRLISCLTPTQQQVLSSHSKRIALLQGRRSGKSWGLAILLIHAALSTSNSTALFLGTSREHARRLMWLLLQQFNDRFSLGMTFNHTDLMAMFPNGSRIWIHGCATKGDAERYRGDKYSIVCIDEAGSFPEYISYLIKSVLSPALADLNGKIVLAGTPNAHCTGYYHDITTEDKGWEVHRGTVLDNPYFDMWNGNPNWRQEACRYLEVERLSNDWADDPNGFAREWLAEWIRDENVLVIPFGEANTYLTKPDIQWTHIMAIDYGVSDPTAIVVGAFSGNNPNLWIPHAEEHSEMSYEESCSLVMKLYKQYNPISLVADPSPGKLFIQDLSNKYGLPIRAADKRDRAHSTNLLAKGFSAGKIKISAHLSEMIDQFKRLQWNDKHTDLKAGQLDHYFDATRYLLTESYHTFGHTPENAQRTPEQQMEAEAERIQRNLELSWKRQRSNNKWKGGRRWR